MKKTIEKPLMVRRQELIEKLTSAVNEAGLPFAVSQPIVKDLLTAMTTQMDQETQRERAEYEAALKEAMKEVEE